MIAFDVLTLVFEVQNYDVLSQNVSRGISGLVLMLTWFITGNRFDVDYRTGELLDNTRHSCKYCNIRRSDALLDTVLSQ